MASEFFARKLNLELVLNPLFHGPHEELREDTPPANDVTYTRINHAHNTIRGSANRTSGNRTNFTTISHINSFEYKHHNPRGVYDFLKVKMARENARTKGRKRQVSKGKKPGVIETGSSGQVDIIGAKPETSSPDSDISLAEPDAFAAKPSVNCSSKETVNSDPELTELVPEILHYSDEITEGVLEVYEPVFVRFPVWKVNITTRML